MGNGSYPLQIPVDMLSKETSYSVEIDFASCSMGWNSWNFGFLRTASIDGASNLIVSGLNGDFNCFSVDVTDADDHFNYTESSINSQTFWANSTMKVVNRLTANNNVVWDFYKDDTLIFTTNEYETDGTTPMFWDNSSIDALFALAPEGGAAFSGTITGMRISINE